MHPCQDEASLTMPDTLFQTIFPEPLSVIACHVIELQFPGYTICRFAQLIELTDSKL